ncbi:50S ribosomal protein L25 [Ruficoccus sp. ZRK36]|uniref:50S ribosomal protein L25 n=1 Tax=Ruficoccus sp. ZRK36 TaxID=2866311 RepID=UPI001C73AE46|nr:50S ribosomal protein L25 [Ruficoccus sp. ZRK36]QYY35257.1 50S ribosomal protein L25 [Ruficoccus sp. ZRK36]
MSEHTLSVSKREGQGRGFSRRLRAQGSIPAVIYGKSGSEKLAVTEKDFMLLMREIGGSATIVTLEDDKGGKTATLIQDTQRNPRTDRFEHIDFLEVSADQEITAQIPVHTHGEAVGVKTGGGSLEIALHEVEVSCLPKNLPEQIDLDVSGLDVGDMIHVSALPKLEGVTYQGDPETVVVMCNAPMAEEAPAEDEAEAAGDDAEAKTGEEA